MGTMTDGPDKSCSDIAIMAHPPSRKSDLSFETFLDRCVEEARHHLKLDFKDFRSLQLCLPRVAAVKPRLVQNGQVVWINADILPGPSKRWQGCAVPAPSFFAAVQQHCPGVALSLGWRVTRAWGDSYTRHDVKSMLEACKACEEDQALVFAVNARLALRNAEPLLELLGMKPQSQLLLWTGTGEPPLPSWTWSRLVQRFAGAQDRVGYDCQVASSCFHGLACQFQELCLATVQFLARSLDGLRGRYQ